MEGQIIEIEIEKEFAEKEDSYQGTQSVDLDNQNEESENTKWQKFANELGASVKENFSTSYQDLFEEIEEQIVNDAHYDSNTEFQSEESPIENPIRLNKKNLKSAETKFAKTSNKIRKRSAIASFLESMAITITNADLPIEGILQIQKEVLDIITNRIVAYQRRKQLPLK